MPKAFDAPLGTSQSIRDDVIFRPTGLLPPKAILLISTFYPPSDQHTKTKKHALTKQHFPLSQQQSPHKQTITIMARGNAELTKVLYKGKDNQTYLVVIESHEDYEKWKKDESSVPLAQVLSGWKILTTHKYASSALSPD